MSDANANLPAFSVSELAGALKRTVEDRFGHVRVRGEISGLKVAASGHVYLALKDDAAVLDAVMWKGTASGLRFRPEDGLEVICTGKITTYPGRSKYQIVIERMEVAGAGALMALLEQRKQQFAAEGLFAAERKRPIPFLPSIIGVVTSPTGAVIRDILHRLADRFPRRVLLWPVLVQGEGAAAQVAAAIQGFNAMTDSRPDVLIVARGGGSIEDLWAFNEEIVVRAVAASSIPVISAVGHETDTTLIDHVADRRAPTPTAAAEMAVPVRTDLRDQVQTLDLRLQRARQRLHDRLREALRAAVRALPAPRDLLALAQQRHDDVAGRLPRALRAGAAVWQGKLDRVAARLTPRVLLARHGDADARLIRAGAALQRAADTRLQTAQQQTAQAGRLLDTLSPLGTLRRGYAVVRQRQGAVVTDRAAALAARVLDIEFHDGSVPVRVEGASAVPRGDAPSTAGTQGRLF